MHDRLWTSFEDEKLIWHRLYRRIAPFGGLLFSLAMILFGISALRALRGQPGRIAPLLIAVFALLAFLFEADPYHDIAFTLFGLTWVLLGLSMWRNR